MGDGTFSLVSLVSAGLGIGFAPEWTPDLPNRNFELRKVRSVDFRIGLDVAWSKDDPTATRDDIIDIVRSLASDPPIGRNGLPGGYSVPALAFQAVLC
ncbi:DNA-binding transcriptional LysR family regulator [Ensifer adhaerens]|uniref:DNA-binding transcriptional LysR family regulator n=1 Tax=Ensifer adhaerens TaxID=106592 RepID=A0ACC5ST53_ENSAD|nr:DNA-binding transcriptional LysR family regulator [Ensifer adhaerens]